MKEGNVQKSEALASSDKSILCGLSTPINGDMVGPILNSYHQQIATGNGTTNFPLQRKYILDREVRSSQIIFLPFVGKLKFLHIKPTIVV
jgi:hypothetical protein